MRTNVRGRMLWRAISARSTRAETAQRAVYHHEQYPDEFWRTSSARSTRAETAQRAIYYHKQWADAPDMGHF